MRNKDKWANMNILKVKWDYLGIISAGSHHESHYGTLYTCNHCVGPSASGSLYKQIWIHELLKAGKAGKASVNREEILNKLGHFQEWLWLGRQKAMAFLVRKLQSTLPWSNHIILSTHTKRGTLIRSINLLHLLPWIIRNHA